MDLAEALALVEASPDHRVLRRISMEPERLLNVDHIDGDVHRGLFVDTETTGLDHAKDAVVEFGAVPFSYNDGGTIHGIGRPFHAYIDPGRPIPPEMTKIHGITDAMVAGKSIDRDALAEFAHGANLVIAHHAEFDRPFCERIWSGFEAMPWACSVEQVPWDQEGVEGRKLSYIAASLGYFYDAHNAMNDCLAALFLLSLKLPSGRTGLARMLERAMQDSRRVWAIDSPFETKDILKARGYRWSDGKDGRHKAWHKEVWLDELDAELAYLRTDIYRRETTPDRAEAIAELIPPVEPKPWQAIPDGEYAIVELFGHTTLIGRINEVERFGAKMMALEPLFAGRLLDPVLHGGAAIYRLTPCSREIAWSKQPMDLWHLPPSIKAVVPVELLPAPEPPSQGDDGGDDDDDDAERRF